MCLCEISTEPDSFYQTCIWIWSKNINPNPVWKTQANPKLNVWHTNKSVQYISILLGTQLYVWISNRPYSMDNISDCTDLSNHSFFPPILPVLLHICIRATHSPCLDPIRILVTGTPQINIKYIHPCQADEAMKKVLQKYGL